MTLQQRNVLAGEVYLFKKAILRLPPFTKWVNVMQDLAYNHSFNDFVYKIKVKIESSIH